MVAGMSTAVASRLGRATAGTSNVQPWGRSSCVGSCVARSSLRTDLSASADDELGGGEALGAHRAVGVEPCRRDSDLGTEAELAAVGKPRRGVDHDGGGVDLAYELFGGGLIGRDDRFGVIGAVSLDVLDRG